MTPTDTPPNTIPWPPILLASSVAAVLLLDRFLPVDTGWPAAPGWGLIAAALAIDGAAMAVMARARTNILPHRPADRLVTTGPFRLSRNPIYVGNVMLVLGAGLAAGSLWGVPAAILDGVLTHRLAVLREERHLESRFGEAWRRYAAKTPRWLGLPRAA